MNTDKSINEEKGNAVLPIVSVSFCALAKDDMGDDLCKYCSLEKKGVYGVDGGYMAGCEGSRCDDSYENYLEQGALANER